MLKVENLNFEYSKSIEILKDITFSLKKGEICTLLGPNGSGKSTLLKCIDKLLRPKRGVIIVENENIDNLTEKELAKKISFLPQEHNSPFPYTVLDIVLMGRAPYIGMLSKPSKKDVKIAKRCIEIIGIGELMYKPYTQLSGGQKKLVLIARALAQEPKILLLDEPTNHLDFKNQYMVLSKMREIVKNNKLSSIITLHDPNLASIFSDKIVMLKRGKIIGFGDVNEVMTLENLRKLYDMDIEMPRINYNRKIILPKLENLVV
ncbi:ABC transporter ATP-binding protein [Methanotorris formicicus]|uniref:ABC transporter related protein n=1 Tax=Methanotorris formicicus Mc-S-70 TaxID=647171 RepID=H1KWV9_9EURY|nr:ABC transporter ATP-binding protein [Methanotorris formicicus]EHP89092.1 ABC transporter related protein [Methanotorris formicicus Mc-S-70]